MDEVSNKTLATLLVVAIVISLAGMFFAMKGVSEVTNIITGAQTAPLQTGTAKVNITETTSILLLNATVDFGSGYRDTSQIGLTDSCNLTTNQSTKPGCWFNSTAWAPMPFLLENNGNNYVNVTINSSNSSNFLNGTVLGGNRKYSFLPIDASNDAVNTGVTARGKNGCNSTFSVVTWTEFSEVPQLICTNMSPTNTEDSFYVEINISVPSGVTGSKSAAVTFGATKSAQG